MSLRGSVSAFPNVSSIALALVATLLSCGSYAESSENAVEERSSVFKRTPMLTAQQASAYLSYVESKLSSQRVDLALPVLELLTNADGVPDDTLRRSRQLLEDLSSTSVTSDVADLEANTNYPLVTSTNNISLYATISEDKNLGGDTTGRLSSFDADASVSVDYAYNESISGYLEMGVTSNTFLGENRQLAGEPAFYRGDTWLSADFSSPSLYRSATIGTQSISDRRGWWWDDTLDLIYLSLSGNQWQLNTAVGAEKSYELFGERPEGNDKIIRAMSDISFAWRPEQSVSAFLFTEFDRSDRLTVGEPFDTALLDDGGQELYWIGVRSQGSIDRRDKPAINYWIDLAHSGGQETLYGVEADTNDETVSVIASSSKIQLDGWGLDAGLSMRTNLPAKPRLSIGYATTTADSDMSDNTDRSFRQTGLQSNQTDLDALGTVSYYGLVLNPELSNLQILTLGIGFDILSNSQFNVIGHDYRLLSATEELRSADVDLLLTGTDRQAGREINFVLSLEERDVWDFTVLFGLFKAGKAVADAADSTAYYGSVELSVDF